MTRVFNRRTALRGMLGGGAVTVGLPLLDIFLDGNGEAMAAPPPSRQPQTCTTQVTTNTEGAKK